MNDEAERIRCALSLALQFVPLTSVRPDEQADIDLIRDLVQGRAVPWDELDRIRRREVIETALSDGQQAPVAREE
jgi:hypothetical protein